MNIDYLIQNNYNLEGGAVDFDYRWKGDKLLFLIDIQNLIEHYFLDWEFFYNVLHNKQDRENYINTFNVNFLNPIMKTINETNELPSDMFILFSHINNVIKLNWSVYTNEKRDEIKSKIKSIYKDDNKY